MLKLEPKYLKKKEDNFNDAQRCSKELYSL